MFIVIFHIKAQKNGGKDTKRNGQTLCEACNKAKGGLDYRFKRRNRPSPDVTFVEHMKAVAANRQIVNDLMREKQLNIKIKIYGKNSPWVLAYKTNQQKHKRHKERNKIGEV